MIFDKPKQNMQKIAVILFDEFETLDVFGPVEIFGRLQDLYSIDFFSEKGGEIINSHGVKIITKPMADISNLDILLIPGGYGTRVEANNKAFIEILTDLSIKSEYVLTVCTGTGLLAKTGLIDGKNATTNKRAFDWVMSQGSDVNWIKKARWVVDGKYYTSAGVSAGMDMAFGFLADSHGIHFARKIAYEIEYTWQEDKDLDEFYLQDFI